MPVLTVKLDDRFATDVERFRQEANFATKSDLVREALKLMMIEWRKKQLQANLERYLQDETALAEAAAFAEANMALTVEALQEQPDADSTW